MVSKPSQQIFELLFSTFPNVKDRLRLSFFNLGSGDEVVMSPPLNRKVGCSRPTMIRARCLRVRQHYPAQKNNQKIAFSS